MRSPPLPDGTCRGYRVDYVDGEPRITYNRDQVDNEALGALVHDLVTTEPIVDTYRGQGARNDHTLNRWKVQFDTGAECFGVQPGLDRFDSGRVHNALVIRQRCGQRRATHGQSSQMRHRIKS